MIGVFAALAAGPSLAQSWDDDAQRQARRQALREQLQAEGDRWRAQRARPGPGADGRDGESGGAVAPPIGRRLAPGKLPPPASGSPLDFGAPPAQGAHPGDGVPPAGWVPGGEGAGLPRLSPDERRALREALRLPRP